MDLIDKLPSLYDNDITKPIQASFNIETNILSEEVENALIEVLSVDDSVKYIDYWEKMLGITNINLDIQTRQENVKAKMRTRGTSTLSVIKNICEAYSNGQVAIIIDDANYSFKVKFVGSIGIPKALDEIQRVIDEIKPCHLAHNFEYVYNTYLMLNSKTNLQLKTRTYKQMREVAL